MVVRGEALAGFDGRAIIAARPKKSATHVGVFHRVWVPTAQFAPKRKQTSRVLSHFHDDHTGGQFAPKRKQTSRVVVVEM